MHNPAVHVHSPSLVIELPVSVALREYVHIPYEAVSRVTRDGVLRRDRYVCAYCGGHADTVDHACQYCNGLRMTGHRRKQG